MDDDETPIGKHYAPTPDSPANRTAQLGVVLAASGIIALFFSTYLALGLFAIAIVLGIVWYIIQP